MSFTDMTDVPDGLTTDAFVLRPITADDAEIDYAAVMESREFLRKWEQSSWPEDDFTVEANRKDLEGLEKRHDARSTFTYTVIDAAGTRCLGCVYIVPTDSRMFASATISAVDGRQWNDYDAVVYFWVRKSELAARTDRTLLDELRRWLSHEWTFTRTLFVTNEEFTQQVNMIEETDLRLCFTIAEPGNSGKGRAYA
ncbi:MAG TPA: hypothetical protein H9881_14540 [Candidatus Stackebrandtia excrementipullorum]|nr:hypothetical protein [Candidatus Stackebrandtia excrementipullorum]